MTRDMVSALLASGASWLGNPISMLFAIHRKPVGWWIVAVTQGLLAAFVFVAADARFGGQVICFAIGCYGVWRWQLKRAHEPAIGKAAEQVAAGGEVPTNGRAVYIGTPAVPAAAGLAQFPPERMAPAVLPAAGQVPNPRQVGQDSAPPVIPTLRGEAKTESLTPRTVALATRNGSRVVEGHGWDAQTVAEVAIAALNHTDPKLAQLLQTRLGDTR